MDDACFVVQTAVFYVPTVQCCTACGVAISNSLPRARAQWIYRVYFEEAEAWWNIHLGTVFRVDIASQKKFLIREVGSG